MTQGPSKMRHSQEAQHEGIYRPNYFFPAVFAFQENVHTHRSVVKMYPTTSLQVSIRTQKITAKNPEGKNGGTTSEKGDLQGTWRLGFPGTHHLGESPTEESKHL